MGAEENGVCGGIDFSGLLSYAMVTKI